jgi:hypothetical protein
VTINWILDVLTDLYTRLGTTSNYGAIANLHTLQITDAYTKSEACSIFSSLQFFETSVK